MSDLKNAVALFAVVVEHLEKVSREYHYDLGVSVSRTCGHFVEAMENDQTARRLPHPPSPALGSRGDRDIFL